MERFKRTFAYYEDLNAEKAFDTAEGAAYYCPFCFEKEVANGVSNPKPDRHGKLYINVTTKQGYCFRCDTVVISKKDKDKLKITLIDNSEIFPDLTNLPAVDLAQIPPAYNNEEAMNYLRSRNKAFTPNAVKKLDLRWVENIKTIKNDNEQHSTKIRRTGIMIPLRYNEVIKSYQIRYITDNKNARFHTMEGKKLLACVKNVPKFSEISIAEGYFDAVALACMGFPNPVALLGKSPSYLQFSQLRELVPHTVNVCLDERPLSYNLLRLLKKELKAVENYKIWDFYGSKDPEDYYRAHPRFRYSSTAKKNFILIQ